MGLGYMGILTYGMQFVDSGKTSVLVYTMPIFVTVISHFTLNEKMNVYKTIGLISGFFGLLFIFGKEMLNVDQSALFGELCVLAAALSWGIANVFSKLQFKHIDIIHMNAWHLLMGAIMLLVFSFILEPVYSASGHIRRFGHCCLMVCFLQVLHLSYGFGCSIKSKHQKHPWH